MKHLEIITPINQLKFVERKKMNFKKIISQKFPYLGKWKRLAKGIIDVIGSKKSYSQHGEDFYFLELIKSHNIDITEYCYIDVGANHPTDISNTYLLYKLGMSGVIIEPNLELVNLFKLFRKRDQRLAIGVSNENTILKFFISKTPVISSFNKEWMASDILKTSYVPVLTLDNALKNLLSKNIFLLSIDVEGLNKEVIEGGLETIKKSLFLCIEFDDEQQKMEFKKILNEDFEEIISYSCNMICRNKHLNPITLKQ